MNGQAPAFQFYPADYLSDEKVQAMSIEGEGCYIRLLSYCWKEGSIPADREAIVKLCKGYAGPGINEAISCFVDASKIRKNSKLKGRMVHKRLIQERIKQEKFSKSMQEAGLHGAEKRWGKNSQAIARGIAKNGSSSSSSSSSSDIPLSIGVSLPPIPKNLSFKVMDHLRELKAAIMADERLLKNKKAMARKQVTPDEVKKRMRDAAEKYIQAIEDRR
jgi:hypothetical protein